MKIFIAVLSLLAPLASGCSTMKCHDDLEGDYWTVKHGLYRGVRFDFKSIAEAESEQKLAVPYYVIDAPFSLVGDTLFLPFDVVSLLAKPKTGNPESK